VPIAGRNALHLGENSIGGIFAARFAHLKIMQRIIEKTLGSKNLAEFTHDTKEVLRNTLVLSAGIQ